MNEEEKKAIELLEDIKNNTWTTKYIMSSDSKNAKVLLNLIEKPQKENEELHKEIERMKSLDIYKLVEDWETGQLISVQEVKDKIEELREQDKKWTEELSEPDSNFKVINRHLKRIKNQIDVLQELLERRK